jgi:hypothetical protein
MRVAYGDGEQEEHQNLEETSFAGEAFECSWPPCSSTGHVHCETLDR